MGCRGVLGVSEHSLKLYSDVCVLVHTHTVVVSGYRYECLMLQDQFLL
jgi:hypothetical protein